MWDVRMQKAKGENWTKYPLAEIENIIILIHKLPRPTHIIVNVDSQLDDAFNRSLPPTFSVTPSIRFERIFGVLCRLELRAKMHLWSFGILWNLD